MLRLITITALGLALATPALAAESEPTPEPVDADRRAPELVRRAFPAYPPSIRDQGIGGDVLLELSLDETGRPYAVRVVTSLHPELDAEAVIAARKLLFRPATIGGEPHPSTIDYRFTFHPDAALHEGPATENVGNHDAIEVGEGVTIVDTRPWRVFKQVREAEVEGTAVGTYRFGRRDLELAPGAVSDINMVIHTLPSVSRSSFFVGNFSIRGGAPEETVTYLDGVRFDVPDIQGLLSRFNPNLVETVTVHAGSQPAQFGESVAGVTDIRYSNPQNDRFHALVDLNLLTLSGQVSGPIGPKNSPVSFVFSARRALLDLYLAIIELTGLYDGLKFGYGDAFTRIHVDPGNRGTSVLDVSFLWADAHITSQPEGAILNVERKNSLLASIRHRWRPSERFHWDQQVALTWEEDKAERDEVLLERSARLRPSARTDLGIGLWKDSELLLGAEFGAERLRDEGAFFDVRRRPTWIESAWADDIALRTPLDTQRWNTELGIYAEVAWKSFLDLPIEGRFGARITPINPTGVPTVSPRGALALRLKSGTTFKVHGGLSHQYPTQQGVYDPVIGAVDPEPGQAITVAASIEQTFNGQADFGRRVSCAPRCSTARCATCSCGPTPTKRWPPAARSRPSAPASRGASTSRRACARGTGDSGPPTRSSAPDARTPSTPPDRTTTSPGSPRPTASSSAGTSASAAGATGSSPRACRSPRAGPSPRCATRSTGTRSRGWARPTTTASSVTGGRTPSPCASNTAASTSVASS